MLRILCWFGVHFRSCERMEDTRDWYCHRCKTFIPEDGFAC